MALIDLANPTRFLALVARVLPWLAAATVVAFAAGLYLAAVAPDDYQHGAVVKIMFIHVPNAWLAMGVWTVMSIASIGTLVWRHPLADVAAKSAAPLGAAFTFLALLSGSLWGRPMWGTYWVWDAASSRCGAPWRIPRVPDAPPRSSRWSAPSICRSSSSRSTGGTRCTSRLR
jgi:heme exporter protein C